MHTDFIHPFVQAAVNVLRTMASVAVQAGTPSAKPHAAMGQGDISAVVGLTGPVNGSLAISFSEKAICQIVSHMFGEPVTAINDEVRDAVGELCNMISGDARRLLAEQGYPLQAAIPTVIEGRGHRIRHVVAGPSVVVPFTLDGETAFCLEVCWDSEST
ncbi:MAG: chemotaxis protein CheX [Candidatus Tectimicrobiota bacterium]|nr:MAG: chemotaxis protein CheX [Candidatus Tectomicrobia bacterium]